MSAQHGHEVVIETPMANKVIAYALAAVALFVVLVFITNVDATLFQAMMLGGGAAIGLYAYRTIRTRAIASDAGLTIHNLRRTVTLAWADVDHLAVSHLKHNQGTGIEVVTRDGDHVPIEASWGPWYSTAQADETTLRSEEAIADIERIRTGTAHGAKDSPPLPSIGVTWLTAFVDLPTESWDAGVAFWTRATRSTVSDPRGDSGEFVTLRPEEGDPYLKMQRIEGSPRIHLDVHVDSVEAATERAVGLGARVIAQPGYAVLTSPAGMVFCLVSDGGEAEVPRAETSITPNRVDQMCINIPGAAFDRECAFWASLTGWRLRDDSRVEFKRLERPEGIPFRVVLQRLGREDERSEATAHLDFAGGEHVTDLMMRHMRYDSQRIENKGAWIVMEDPVGLPYWISSRDPHAGAAS